MVVMGRDKLRNNLSLKSALVLALTRHGLQLVLLHTVKEGKPQVLSPTQSRPQAVELSCLAKLQQLPVPRVHLVFSLKIYT